MNVEWLQRYATGYHQWREGFDEGSTLFYRPLGIVESSFDADGTQHEGRADVSMALHFEGKTTMSRTILERHILLAWTCLRLRHALLCATATDAKVYMDTDAGQRNPRFLVVTRPTNRTQALESSEALVAWLGDTYSHVDADDLYHHAQNTARTFDPTQSLVRLFVLPVEETDTEFISLRFLFTIAHQITDGLTNGAWALDFLRLLNKDSKELEDLIEPLSKTLPKRLPLPQEDLYLPINGSRARQRWFWAITLVLRHVQKAMPAAFQNPLRFTLSSRTSAVPETRQFEQVLDYSRAPTLNAGNIRAIVGQEGTRRLHSLCRQTGCSIGAGCFVLVGVVMMELYEQRFPHSHPDQRRPFIGSFPIDPRQLFNHVSEPDGLMLAFSDGIVLPFLPSDLDLDGRIRLLIRSAQRQLSRYQKRPRKHAVQNAIQYMGARGAGRVVPMNYLDIIERANSRVPESMRMNLGYQKLLPKQANPTLATCGVSSVGRADPHFQPGQYDLTQALGENELVVDARGQKMNVRPRDGEFLVGISGNDHSIHATVSYDACTIDARWAEKFKKKMVTLLEGTTVTSKL